MFKSIVLLGVACVWLLAERHSLSEKMTTIEGKVETMRRQKSDLDAKVAVMEGRAVAKTSERPTTTTVPPKSWLQDQIENHASLSRLETSNAQSGSSRSYVRPRYY